MFSAPQPASSGAETTIPQSTSRRMVASLEFSDVSILRWAMHPRESRGRAHFMLRHNLWPTTRGKGIVGTTIGTGSIFGSAHETLTRQTRRHAAAERPDVAGWPAAVV